MKQLILIMMVSVCSLQSFAQYEEVKMRDRSSDEEKGGFKKENLFTGGGIQLSYSNYSFVVGASPVFGYSFNRYFDAGIGLNVTYISDKEAYADYYGNVYTTGNKIHYTDVGPFVFARVYPLKFLFLQAQAEANFISQKYIYATGAPSDKIAYNVNSLLIGPGYCGGRENVGDFFYYFSLSFDVLKKRSSPYVQRQPDGGVSMLPILRAGIQIPLFQGK